MKKWYVDGEAFSNVLDAVDEIVENGDFEEEFEDFLRREYDDEVDICGCYFDAVEALKELDYSEYESKFDEWKEGKREDVERQIERADVGSVLDIDGFEVEVKDADAELISEALADLSAVREWVENAPKLYANNPPIDRIESLKSFIGAMAQRIKEEE